MDQRLIPQVLVVLEAHLNTSYWNEFRRDGLFATPDIFAIIPDTWSVVNPPSPYSGIISELGWLSARLRDHAMNPTHSENVRNWLLHIRSNRIQSRGSRLQWISSWLTVQNDTQVTISPDNMTVYSSDDAPSEDDAKPFPPENAQTILTNTSLDSSFGPMEQRRPSLRPFCSWRGHLPCRPMSVPTLRANVMR